MCIVGCVALAVVECFCFAPNRVLISLLSNTRASFVFSSSILFVLLSFIFVLSIIFFIISFFFWMIIITDSKVIQKLPFFLCPHLFNIKRLRPWTYHRRQNSHDGWSGGFLPMNTRFFHHQTSRNVWRTGFHRTNTVQSIHLSSHILRRNSSARGKLSTSRQAKFSENFRDPSHLWKSKTQRRREIKKNKK